MSATKIEYVYSDVETNQQRYTLLQQKVDQLNLTIKTFVRTPGRINIIAEHTDYNGYQTASIATETDISVAVAHQEGENIVRIINLDEKYENSSFQYNNDIDSTIIAWPLYVKLGLLAARSTSNLDLSGTITLIFSSNLPVQANLAASTSLICASALAFLTFQTEIINPKLLAKSVFDIEKSTFKTANPNDAKVILTSQKGKIQIFKGVENQIESEFLEFIPGVVCACLSSLTTQNRRVLTDFKNLRTAEIIAVSCILTAQKTDFHSILPLPSTQALYGKFGPSGMLCLAQELPEKISLKELQNLLKFESFESFFDQIFTQNGQNLLGESGKISENFTLSVRPRALHVFSEAYRAIQFQKALSCLDTPEWALTQISEQINDSQESLKTHFECSCFQLDEVVKAARAAGAFCAHLCGVGLGGNAIALLHVQDAENFMGQMDEFYAAKDLKQGGYFMTGCGECGGYLDV
ncbi:Galactokinase [Spironucleus salmonicida]|uniref:Galactokinase n=1 Tax=Spironucleus salmonicida TaxID=348837 RepID=V6LGI2_9EUKA|nr:Galactokinase [Spironucleus salmonicida]|eukprot:EST43637.1 Galactokinase [Spironucleus salmonicida]